MICGNKKPPKIIIWNFYKTFKNIKKDEKEITEITHKIIKKKRQAAT